MKNECLQNLLLCDQQPRQKMRKKNCKMELQSKLLQSKENMSVTSFGILSREDKGIVTHL